MFYGERLVTWTNYKELEDAQGLYMIMLTLASVGILIIAIYPGTAIKHKILRIDQEEIRYFPISAQLVLPRTCKHYSVPSISS